MLPGSHYELFTVSQDVTGAWQAFVHPEYYGLLMFAQAFPPGARLLPVTAPSGPVKVWATVGADGTTRVVLINQDPSAEHDVQLQLPARRRRPRWRRSAPRASPPPPGSRSAARRSAPRRAPARWPAPLPTTPLAPVGGSTRSRCRRASAAMLTSRGAERAAALVRADRAGS